MSAPSVLRSASSLLAVLCCFTACEKQETTPPAPAPVEVPGEPVVMLPAPVAEAPAEPMPETAIIPPPPVADPAPAAGPSVQEQAALEVFKGEMKEIREYVDTHADVKPEDGLRTMLDLFGRMKEVKSADLPTDLRLAYQGLIKVMDRLETALSLLPVPAMDLEKWAEEQSAKGPEGTASVQAVMKAHQDRMSGIQQEGAAATAKLKAVAAQYGIEPVDIGADGQ